jgi:FMN-dependent NADH-azoreductase
MKILHLDTSIGGTNSASRRISAEIVRDLAARGRDVDVIHRDLTETPLSHLTLAEIAAEASQAALADFQAADVVVIGTGMYNFTVPSQLKAWIDRILVAGRTFQYADAGPQGLAGGKRIIIALARGGFYAPSSPAAALEHAKTYLRGVFAFIGVNHVEFVTAGTAMPAERDASIKQAEQQAAALAA